MSDTQVMTPHHEQPGRPPYRPRPFIRPMPVAVATTVLIALLVLLWYSVEVLLLVFAGVLLAVFLRSLSDGLSQYTPLRGKSALLVVVITLVASFGMGIWLLAPQLGAQVGQLAETLPRSIQSLHQRLQQHSLGPWLLSQPPSLSDLRSHLPNAAAREILQALGHTLRWWLLGRGVSMLMVGLFIAAGLWLIGVPLALTFGLLAALLTFAPTWDPPFPPSL